MHRIIYYGIVTTILCLFLLNTNNCNAQTSSPKYEFRAAWIATIGGIDWPSKYAQRDATLQQEELITLFDKLQQCGMNAVIIQIRPCADAFYNSSYEPWSKYLTGVQGVAPYPYYDPLVFICTEAHKRGLELHAWFNPYRALVDQYKNPNPSNHITRTNPEWFLNYGGKKYFDPGLPEVRNYFTKIVLDVVERYDIDAVHFDDYFYPYRIAYVEFPDYKSYSMYGGNFANKDDWRRNNVTILIEQLSKKIKEKKSWVKFGISPFGVWRNFSKDEDGSYTTAGQTNYDDLYADVLLWQKNGWIDYTLPQLYWERGHKAADYIELINWWGRHSYKRHIYIGHGLYQLGKGKSGAWRSIDEILAQIQLTRTTKNIYGSSFYSANSFIKNTYNITYQFQNKFYKKSAIVPAMDWIKGSKPKAPVVEISYTNAGDVILKWDVITEKNNWFRYIIYRFDKQEQIDLSKTDKILAITSENTYIDASEKHGNYKYVVTAVNRQSIESNYN